LFPQQWIQLQKAQCLVQWRKKADWRFAQNDHYPTSSKVRSQRAEAGMIIDPVTLPLNSTVGDAKALMKEHSIGGIQ
jgi:hypothetical protein